MKGFFCTGTGARNGSRLGARTGTGTEAGTVGRLVLEPVLGQSYMTAANRLFIIRLEMLSVLDIWGTKGYTEINLDKLNFTMICLACPDRFRESTSNATNMMFQCTV